MPLRPIPTLPPPEADIDSPELAEAAAMVAAGEEDLRMLARLAEIGMALAEAQGAYALARLAATSGEGRALSPGEDPTAAFNRIAQTVRRIIALKARLAADLDRRRAGLIAGRAASREKRAGDHARDVKLAIDMALADAFHVDVPCAPSDSDPDPLGRDPVEIEYDEMCEHAERLLGDLDLSGDWLTQPVGETVARLCLGLGLGPDCVTRIGETWFVRRPPTGYEDIQAEGRSCRVKTPPSPSGERQTPQASGWGTADAVPNTG